MTLACIHPNGSRETAAFKSFQEHRWQHNSRVSYRFPYSRQVFNQSIFKTKLH